MSEPEPEVEEQDSETEPAIATDNVGDISVEVNVEDLLAQLESESEDLRLSGNAARRRIEDMLDEKRVAREIMDFEDFDTDD